MDFSANWPCLTSKVLPSFFPQLTPAAWHAPSGFQVPAVPGSSTSSHSQSNNNNIFWAMGFRICTDKIHNNMCVFACFCHMCSTPKLRSWQVRIHPNDFFLRHVLSTRTETVSAVLKSRCSFILASFIWISYTVIVPSVLDKIFSELIIISSLETCSNWFFWALNPPADSPGHDGDSALKDTLEKCRSWKEDVTFTKKWGVKKSKSHNSSFWRSGLILLAEICTIL